MQTSTSEVEPKHASLRQELERRISDIDSGREKLEPFDEKYGQELDAFIEEQR